MPSSTPIKEETVSAPIEVESSRFDEVDLVELMNKSGDAVLTRITEAQDAYLSAAKAAIESAAQPSVDFKLPVVTKVPSVRDVVDFNLTFADRYLANQRAYAGRVLDLLDA